MYFLFILGFYQRQIVSQYAIDSHAFRAVRRFYSNIISKDRYGYSAA